MPTTSIGAATAHRHAYVHALRWVALGLLLLCTSLACTANGYPRNPVHHSAPISAEEAAAFGNIALPTGTNIVDVRTDSDRDTRYQLTLIMTTFQLAELLQQFPGATQPPASDGIALNTSPPVTAPPFFQDKVTNSHGTQINREIMISDVANDEVNVHLSLYTT